MFVRVLPWLVIGSVALGLRLYGLRYALPAVYNPDEVAIVSRALTFAKGTSTRTTSSTRRFTSTCCSPGEDEAITSRIPAGSAILSQPYPVPLEPTADALREAVARSSREMPIRTRLQIERSPYPAPAYRVLLVGQRLDADNCVSVAQLGGNDPIVALRFEHVAFAVLKRYNSPDPATLPILDALAREGRRIAVFSPYKETEGGGRRAGPVLHNTDAPDWRGARASGPVVEIWQIDGPGS